MQPFPNLSLAFGISHNLQPESGLDGLACLSLDFNKAVEAVTVPLLKVSPTSLESLDQQSQM